MREMLLRWSNVLLTDQPRRRLYLAPSLLALVLTIYVCLLGVYAARVAGTSAAVAWVWSLTSIGVMVAVFSAIRVGLTDSMPDPALTTLQIAFTVTSGAVAYALIGPMRAAVFPVLTVVMLFGVFVLPVRTVAYITIYAVLLFGGVMALMSWVDPKTFAPSVELVHFLTLAVVMPVVPLVTMRNAAIRARHQRQYSDLLRVQELAARDELTGLVNRREMTTLLQRAQSARARVGRPYCVAVLDLDHFKSINDHYGHATGDEVLRRFAELARHVIRDQDTLGRWGGEEFVVLFGDSRLAAAHAGVERVRENFEAQQLAIGEHTLRVTLSAGIAEPLDGESFERALSRADQALYDAKSRGRNQVVSA